MQIHSVVFALNRQINKQKVCENKSPCEGNKIFVKYQAQGGGFNPPPLRTPLKYSNNIQRRKVVKIFYNLLAKVHKKGIKI